MKKTILVIVGLAILAVILFRQRPQPPEVKTQPVKSPTIATTNKSSPTTGSPTNPFPVAKHKNVKTRYADFSDREKAEFIANFNRRYRPALSNWCNLYGQRVPFALASVTPDKFVERVGFDPASYGEYIFVVDGITLGIADTKSVAAVDYLNNPNQTRKLETLPNSAEAPKTDTPIKREELLPLLATDGGVGLTPYDVRLIPSGFSGGLNGGVMVHVGGDPNNAASWKFDLVFGADGKLAYYLRGR